MISDFFTTAYTITRPQWLTDEAGNPYSAAVEVETFSGHLQQARAELVANLGLSFTKTFLLWCPVTTDVKAGDSVTDGTNAYSVRAVQRNDIGENRHLELIVELDEVTPAES